MSRLRITLLLITAVGFLSGCRQVIAQEAAGRPVEYEVLGKLVGKWTEEVDMNGTKIEAKGETRWTLNKTHLNSHFVIDLPGGQKMEHLMIMTYDRQAKVYRSWQYTNGAGEPMVATGTFSKEDNKLTMKGELADGSKLTSVTDLSDPDTVPWTVVAKRQNGEVVFSMKGVDKRVKSASAED